MTKKKTESAAHHEAGHAVACSVSGLKIKNVVIDNLTPMESKHYCDHFGSLIDGVPRDPQNNGSVEAYEAEARNYLVGPCAEMKLGYREEGAIRDEFDYKQAQDTLEALYGIENPYLISERLQVAEENATELIERHWPAIVAVAKVLVERKKLLGTEAKQIINSIEGQNP